MIPARPGEILIHQAVLPGVQVIITLEIEARIPEDAPEQVVRTVTQSSRVLRFKSFGIEEK